jgi:hypothetical protein
VSVALWGLGGTQENGTTTAEIGHAWTLVTAPLDVQNSGHSGLRAEIYMDTANENLDADAAQLVSTGLENANFQASASGWFPNANSSGVNMAQKNPGPYGAGYAKVGSGFLEMNTNAVQGSVAQNVPIVPEPGQSYAFSVWLRAPPGAHTPFKVSVALWGLGGTQENGTTTAEIGHAWTLVTAPLDVQNSGHSGLRAEIYMDTANENLDADAATLSAGDAQADSVPDAPSHVVATPGPRRTKVSWVAPGATGGSPLTSFRVVLINVSNKDRAKDYWVGPTNSVSIDGLTAGDRYRFTVQAYNDAGAGPPSESSPTIRVPK